MFGCLVWLSGLSGFFLSAKSIVLLPRLLKMDFENGLNWFELICRLEICYCCCCCSCCCCCCYGCCWMQDRHFLLKSFDSIRLKIENFCEHFFECHNLNLDFDLKKLKKYFQSGSLWFSWTFFVCLNTLKTFEDFDIGIFFLQMDTCSLLTACCCCCCWSCCWWRSSSC